MPWQIAATNLMNDLQLNRGQAPPPPLGWARTAQDFEVYAALSNLHQLLNDALDCSRMPPVSCPPPLPPRQLPIQLPHPTSTFMGGGGFSPANVANLAWTLAEELEQHRVLNNLGVGARWLSNDPNLLAADHQLIQDVHAFLRDALDCD